MAFRPTLDDHFVLLAVISDDSEANWTDQDISEVFEISITQARVFTRRHEKRGLLQRRRPIDWRKTGKRPVCWIITEPGITELRRLSLLLPGRDTLSLATTMTPVPVP